MQHLAEVIVGRIGQKVGPEQVLQPLTMHVPSRLDGKNLDERAGTPKPPGRLGNRMSVPLRAEPPQKE